MSLTSTSFGGNEPLSRSPARDELDGNWILHDGDQETSLSVPWRRLHRFAAVPASARGPVGCARARVQVDATTHVRWEVVSVVQAYRVSAGPGASLVADMSTTQTASNYGLDDTGMDIGALTGRPIRHCSSRRCARVQRAPPSAACHGSLDVPGAVGEAQMTGQP